MSNDRGAIARGRRLSFDSFTGCGDFRCGNAPHRKSRKPAAVYRKIEPRDDAFLPWGERDGRRDVNPFPRCRLYHVAFYCRHIRTRLYALIKSFVPMRTNVSQQSRDMYLFANVVTLYNLTSETWRFIEAHWIFALFMASISTSIFDKSSFIKKFIERNTVTILYRVKNKKYIR